MSNEMNCPKCKVHVDEHEAGFCLSKWASSLLSDGFYAPCSTDIRVAMRMVDECGSNFRLEKQYYGEPPYHYLAWECWVGYKMSGGHVWESDDAALAITRALIKAAHNGN